MSDRPCPYHRQPVHSAAPLGICFRSRFRYTCNASIILPDCHCQRYRSCLSRCSWTGHTADLDSRPRCDHTEPVDTSISNIDPDPEPALDPAASRVLQETQKRDPEPASPQRSRHADKADNQAEGGRRAVAITCTDQGSLFLLSFFRSESSSLP